MSEENINKAMEYIEQNPDQSTQTLVQSLITAGYSTDDIKIALGRLGLSPLSIPGYTEPIQPPASASSFLSVRTTIAIAGALAILIGIYYMGNTNLAQILYNIPFLGKKPELSRPAQTNTTPTDEIATTPDNTQTTSPLTQFREKYEVGTYKITLNQTLRQSDTSEIFVYYTENGFIDRHDNPKGIQFIIRTTAFYTVDGNKKEYSQIDSTDFRYGILIQTLSDEFILNELLSGEESGALDWEKIDENKWKVSTARLNQHFIIEFDNTGFPISITQYNEDNEEFKKSTITFEPITITEELLTVPQGYKQVDQVVLPS